ncbi:hypothetical protein ASG58_21255 [Rhizobium sp. Leaf383]|nr:hypothetical protein ASG58_21255 [Rhizobium sp. Leaf383]
MVSYDRKKEIHMNQYRTPTGALIIGATETTPCVASIAGINADGTPEYDGNGSTMDWDNQTARTRGDKILFVDENGAEWTFDQLTPLTA